MRDRAGAGGTTWQRLRHPTWWEEGHHPEIWIWVRVLSGAWLVVLAGILCRHRRWWGLTLLAAAAVHFYLAFRLGRFVKAQRAAGTGSPRRSTGA